MSEVTFDHKCDAHAIVKDAEAGIVIVEPKRTKVAIVGFAGSSSLDAPFEDDTYEIWTLNQLYRHVPRADRHFDIHHNYEEYVVEGTDYIGWLKTCPIPIYMVEKHLDYPCSVRYPIERMIDKYSDYFTSTIAFMLALAIDEGFTRIDLYGIDLSVGDEYTHQKPCVERLIGYADALGITVGIPAASSLLKQSHRYGYEKDPAEHGPITEIDLQTRKTKLMAIHASKLGELNQLDGALAEVEHLISGHQLRMRKAHWVP